MVILTGDGATHLISDDRGDQLQRFLRDEKPPANRILDVYGDGSLMLAVFSIAGLMSDEQFEDHDHKRKGDWKCKYGHWHAKSDKCAHQSAPQEIAGVTVSADGVDWGSEHTPMSDKLMAKLRRNRQIFERTGRWPQEDISTDAIAETEAMRVRKAAWAAGAVDRKRKRQSQSGYGRHR